MVKKTFLVLICFIGLIIFVSTLHGQGSKKTITLPNGEVVCDLNGEWDALIENLGAYLWVGNLKDMLKITQQGGSFVGVKMIGTVYVTKDAVSIKGELNKNGIKNVRVMTQSASGAYVDCKGQISEDGVSDSLRGTKDSRVVPA
jgi:hypothetical protein